MSRELGVAIEDRNDWRSFEEEDDVSTVKYSPDQPRDDHGRFGEGDGGSDSSSSSGGSKLSEHDEKKLNAWLTGTDGSKELAAEYNKLRSDPAFGEVVDRLPKFEGTAYRGVVMKDGEMHGLEVGKEMEIRRYSSATKDSGIAVNYANERDATSGTQGNTMVVMAFKDARAGDLGAVKHSDFHAAKEDQEVILHRGDRYKVASVRENVRMGPLASDTGSWITLERVK